MISCIFLETDPISLILRHTHYHSFWGRHSSTSAAASWIIWPHKIKYLLEYDWPEIMPVRPTSQIRQAPSPQSNPAPDPFFPACKMMREKERKKEGNQLCLRGRIDQQRRIKGLLIFLSGDEWRMQVSWSPPIFRAGGRSVVGEENARKKRDKEQQNIQDETTRAGSQEG